MTCPLCVCAPPYNLGFPTISLPLGAGQVSISETTTRVQTKSDRSADDEKSKGTVSHVSTGEVTRRWVLDVRRVRLRPGPRENNRSVVPFLALRRP
ncbi:hypothetical protein EVAR_81046_1 [Eumeta japonica]|uniref:Uncharacterized protein n=1 Tax=Eumeta variegata TaxID=151549 RepID=A0A4C1T889_EUMVA|nr:hypothetical protein EVAR_81046_1 [Eumeta japonica]